MVTGTKALQIDRKNITPRNLTAQGRALVQARKAADDIGSRGARRTGRTARRKPLDVGRQTPVVGRPDGAVATGWKSGARHEGE